MKVKIKLRGKEIIIQDIEEVKGIKKFIGLMFKPKETNPLFFSFNSPGKYSIHSFFCNPFLALWFNDRKIVEHKFIESWKVIKPKKKFDKLIEIPFNNKYKDLISFFLD